MLILIIRAMWCILPIVCTTFPLYSISFLWRAFTVNGSAAISYFSYVESVLKGVSTFINFIVGNHLFTSYMLYSVWSTLKPRGKWKFWKCSYLRTDPYWDLISKSSSKTLASSVNSISLLVVLRTLSVESVR